MSPLATQAVGPVDGPPVVLVHGFTQTARSWLPIAHALADDGWRVVMVDAPGHGASSGVRADLWEGADLLGRAGGRAVYVGYSMGARFCLHLAVSRPRLVRGLAVLGATGGIDDPAARAARRRADEALADTIERDGVAPFLDRWLAKPLFATLPDEAAGVTDRLENTADGLASSLRLAGTGTQEPLWDRLGDLTMPALVLAGERDAQFRALGERLAGCLGAGARYAEVPGAGHAAHLEQPDALLALLRPWLAGLCS